MLLTAALLQGLQGGWIKAAGKRCEGRNTVVQQGPLGVAAEKAKADAHQKTIQLGLRQRTSAHLIEAALGGDHKERLREHMSCAIHIHPPRRHRLEQGTLCAGTGPVDLIGQ